MAIAAYYRFTPCCKTAHPCYFQLPVTPLPNLPLVYNYSGPTVIDSMGYPLETGKCYFVEQLTSNDLPWVASLVPCPEPNPSTLLPFTDIAEFCPPNPTPECPCVVAPNPVYNVYSLQPCCGGDPTIVYFVDDTLTDGSTYAYLSPNPDGNLVSPSCYTATQITYTGTGVPPFTQVVFSEFSIVNEGCGESGSPLTSICEVFCLPCVCARYIWTGATGSGTYPIQYIDCNDELQTLNIPTDGVTWTDKICLKYVVSVCPSPNICWTSESYGNCIVDDSDTTDIKYDCPGCYELRDCTGVEQSIYTLSSQVAQYVSTQQVIQIVGSNTCWRVYDTTESCECAIAVTVESVFDDCPSCINPKGYKLTECTTGEVQYTTTDLSNYTTAILQTNCPGCWKVEPIDIVPPSSQPVTVISSFEDCKICNSTFYELVDCSGILENIVTITDLSQYVDSIVQLKYCPDTCWTVTVVKPQEVYGEVIVEQSFKDCPECLVAVSTAKCVSFTNTNNTPANLLYTDITGQVIKVELKAKGKIPKQCVFNWTLSTKGIEVTEYGDCVNGECPVIPLPKRKVTPGYNTAVCSTEYYENVECNFADWMYKDVLEKRYGIANCCPEELMKWEIKHEMLMLDILVNPDYTCATVNSCNCPSICNCGYISLDIVYTTCPTPPVTCTIYNISILSPTGGTLYYKDCIGQVITEDIPGTKATVSYPRCGISGQTDTDIYFVGTTLVFTILDTATPC